MTDHVVEYMDQLHQHSVPCELKASLSGMEKHIDGVEERLDGLVDELLDRMTDGIADRVHDI